MKELNEDVLLCIGERDYETTLRFSECSADMLRRVSEIRHNYIVSRLKAH